MANDTIGSYEWICICSSSYRISIIKIEMELFQEIAMYLTVAGALGFLLRKYIFPKRTKKGCNSNSGTNCGCS